MLIPDTSTSPAMQRILRVLERKQGMSVSDLSAEAFVGATTLACGGYIKALKARQLIFISGWRQVKGRFSTPLYSAGSFPDVLRPQVNDLNRDAPGMWRILETVERYGGLSYREIARYSGLSLNTVKNSGYLAALIAQKKMHIGGWRRSIGGPMLAVYYAGEGRMAERPEPFSGREKSRRLRNRREIAQTSQGLLQFFPD